MATLGEQSGRDTYFIKHGKNPAKTWLHYKIPKLSLPQCLMFIDASQKPHTENGLNAFSKGWLKYMYRYKKPLLWASSFQFSGWMDLLILETLDLSCFILSLIFLTLFHAQLWQQAGLCCWPFIHRQETSLLWNTPSGNFAHWLLPAAHHHLAEKCQKYREHQLKQSHPALPLSSLENFGINQLHIQLLTTFSRPLSLLPKPAQFTPASVFSCYGFGKTQTFGI